MTKTKHGGPRPAVREDDGRLARKVDKPHRRVTLLLPEWMYEELVTRYGVSKHGKNWKDVVREMIEEHLHQP